MVALAVDTETVFTTDECTDLARSVDVLRQEQTKLLCIELLPTANADLTL